MELTPCSNRNACSHCIESFERSFRSFPDGRRQIMWPFFDCISCPSLKDDQRTGRCGNCHYSDRECDYEDQHINRLSGGNATIVKGWRASIPSTESGLWRASGSRPGQEITRDAIFDRGEAYRASFKNKPSGKGKGKGR